MSTATSSSATSSSATSITDDETSITIVPTSGPMGSHIVVSGRGFNPNETVDLVLQTSELLPPAHADAQGRFSGAVVTVPTQFFSKFIGDQFDLTATGRASAKYAYQQFRVTG
jgi:hypothetical protein